MSVDIIWTCDGCSKKRSTARADDPPGDQSAASEVLAALAEPAKSYNSYWSSCRDYLTGMGAAINPLPLDSGAFYSSDYEALHSDWMTVRSDLAAVWNTLREVNHRLERLADDQHRPAESTAEPHHAERTAAEQEQRAGASTTHRSHSAGT